MVRGFQRRVCPGLAYPYWKRLSDEVMILSRLEMVGFNPIIIRFVEEVKVMIAQLKIIEPIQ